MTNSRSIEVRNQAIKDVSVFLDNGGHLSAPLKAIFDKFTKFKNELLDMIDDHPQLTLALHDLLSAKDKAIRAKVAELNTKSGQPVGSIIDAPDPEPSPVEGPTNQS